MNTRFLIILVLIILSFILTESFAILVIYLVLNVIGIFILKFLKQDRSGINLFVILFGASMVYALLQFIYMEVNGYDHLQSFDGINVYIPYTQELLESKSLFGLIDTIYNTSSYAFVGSILIPFVYVTKLSTFLGGGIYLPIQMVIILFSSLSSVVLYNILIYKNILSHKAFKYTLVYSLFSIQFYMSTYIVRDMPITLFFTILIYFSFKKFSVKNIVLMIVCVLLIMSMRLSSAIFASLYILLMLFMADKGKSEIKKILSFTLIIGTILIGFLFLNQIQLSFESKQEIYLEKQMDADDGTSTIAAFNSLPLGVSHFVKATYNQFMPLPSWRSLIQTSFRPESYNSMNFPVISATYFRYCMWILIIFGFCNKKIRSLIKNDKILFLNFLIGILFLLLQSSTMGHRRMMGVYPVFFLVAILIYKSYKSSARNTILSIATLFFIILQLFGAYYLIK